MKSKKRVLLTLLVLVIFGAAAIWFFSSYKIVGGRLYAKNAETIDLRGKELTLEEYEQLQEALPESQLLWDIPFQGSRYPQETETLSVTSLTEADVAALTQFSQLKQLQAQQCQDYDLLAQLIQEKPQLEVLCSVTLDGTTYDQDATAVALGSCTQEELAGLKCLTKLTSLHISGGMEPAVYTQLQEYCQNKGITLEYALAGQVLGADTTELTLTQPTQDDLAVLALMPQLTNVHLADPVASAEAVLALQKQLPNTQITWDKNILGITFSWDTAEVDLTDVLSRETPDGVSPYWEAAAQYVLGDRDPLPSAVSVIYQTLVNREAETQELIAQVEDAMVYLPNAEKLVMVGCYLDNEAMAAFREAHRDDYQVAWTVKCGDIAPRTDATYFMPTKYNVYHFYSADGYNLKYCEDIVCIDIGHMPVEDISFTAHMPKLKYLVLGESHVNDISPLANCKELVFLEVQRTMVHDLTPLLECTKLEDLNIGTLWDIDLEVVKKMTWLKNLWMATYLKDLKEMQAALPNTNIKAPSDTTVINNGWRDLPNYFAMRDALIMYYME